MRVSHIIDYKAKTAAFFTHCALPEHLQRLVESNRQVLNNIAARASRDIAQQATADSRSHILGNSVDRMV